MYGVKYKDTVQTEVLTVGEAILFIIKWQDPGPVWPDNPDWAIVDLKTGLEVRPQPVVPYIQSIHDEKRTLAQLILDLQARAEVGGDNQMLYVTISQLEAAKRDLSRFISRQPLGINASEGGP